MNNRIQEALTKLFDQHRIIFWYDTNHEMRENFESLELHNAEKIEINNNEFGIKYRVLRLEPHKNFLLYHEGAKPDKDHNWLLDMQLAYGELRTDKFDMYLSDLGLGLEFIEIIQQHQRFFASNARRLALKDAIQDRDSLVSVRRKMLAVCAQSDARMDSIMENLLQDEALEKSDKMELIARCGLDSFLWHELKQEYGYTSTKPSVLDFALTIFKDCFAQKIGEGNTIPVQVCIFLDRWKDSTLFRNSFKIISQKCSEMLSIEDKLYELDIRQYRRVTYFNVVDYALITHLAQNIASRTIDNAEVLTIIQERRQSPWFEELESYYACLTKASEFFYTLHKANLSVTSFANAIENYTSSWYCIDQLYREFIYHFGKTEYSSLLIPLAEEVEKFYVNIYLSQLGNNVQHFVNNISSWKSFGTTRQDAFFTQHIAPNLGNRKICVIIVDAMRYEVGKALERRILTEDRYHASTEHMLAMLPSYTQLGMAALLPHTELCFDEGDKGTVLVDGQSSQGSQNRLKILQNACAQNIFVSKAKDMALLQRDALREIISKHDVFYIYHNKIDAIGDDSSTEENTCNAVEESLQELVSLVKKLMNASLSNVLITADHGFLYQHSPVDESDFIDASATGDSIYYTNRRFVLGKGLIENPALCSFTEQELGLTGDMEAQIPNSIHRLRRKGAGSRFVHGGATLQEVIIPVIEVKKKRQSDVSTVEVGILDSASKIITSVSKTIIFAQRAAVTEKVKPLTLRVAFFNDKDEAISNVVTLTFDVRSTNPRDWEQKATFTLNLKNGTKNNKKVQLRLEEQCGNTSHYQVYTSSEYTIRQAFGMDF